MVSEVKNPASGITSLSEARVRSVGEISSVKPKPSPEDVAPQVADKVSLTEMAAGLKALEKSLADVPEVDKKRVESIKEAVTNGTYQVNANRVADKLIRFESMLTNKADS